MTSMIYYFMTYYVSVHMESHGRSGKLHVNVLRQPLNSSLAHSPRADSACKPLRDFSDGSESSFMAFLDSEEAKGITSRQPLLVPFGCEDMFKDVQNMPNCFLEVFWSPLTLQSNLFMFVQLEVSIVSTAASPWGPIQRALKTSYIGAAMRRSPSFSFWRIQTHLRRPSAKIQTSKQCIACIASVRSTANLGTPWVTTVATPQFCRVLLEALLVVIRAMMSDWEASTSFKLWDKPAWVQLFLGWAKGWSGLVRCAGTRVVFPLKSSNLLFASPLRRRRSQNSFCHDSEALWLASADQRSSSQTP